jgi:hypothetical protein
MRFLDSLIDRQLWVATTLSRWAEAVVAQVGYIRARLIDRSGLDSSRLMLCHANDWLWENKKVSHLPRMSEFSLKPTLAELLADVQRGRRAALSR